VIVEYPELKSFKNVLCYAKDYYELKDSTLLAYLHLRIASYTADCLFASPAHYHYKCYKSLTHKCHLQNKKRKAVDGEGSASPRKTRASVAPFDLRKMFILSRYYTRRRHSVKG